MTDPCASTANLPWAKCVAPEGDAPSGTTFTCRFCGRVYVAVLRWQETTMSAARRP